MATRSKAEECRICGGNLQGNQRRWLFASQRKGSQIHTPTESTNTLSPCPLSPAQSSPWGSTVSLGSSHLHYKAHTLPTPNKGMDLLSVLTHILGQAVPRGKARGEFICGKCVSVLERVFKFDTVIARVRVLSSERLQKLTKERDSLRRWVRSIYRQHHPFDLRARQSSSEEDVELGEGDRHGDPGGAYREMLRDNMALSAYECWSEKSDSCPYFKRTGKRCSKLKNCDCCDSLRVSDSDYESVCGVPRNLPGQAPSPLGLSRDKSRSMPLHWPKTPSLGSSPASLSGSCHSLQAKSRTLSTQSLDYLDGPDPFDFPEEQSFVLESIRRELKGIEGKPIRSPAGSRIPVLGRAQGCTDGVTGSTKKGLVQVLKFREGADLEEDEVGGEMEDVLTELRDEFLPLCREVTTGRVHLVVRQLREQLDQAKARIRILEEGLQEGDQSSNASPSVSSPPVYLPSNSQSESELIHHLSQSLQSREKVIQECVTLIRKLCVEVGAGIQDTDKLIKMTLGQSNMLSERESVLEAQVSDLRESECSVQKELESLRQAGRQRERDLITLNSVLQSNQDVINHLWVELAERMRSLEDVQKQRVVWKARETALQGVLQEKENVISRLQEALESSHNNVQALSDSLIGRGLSGSGAEAALANQVREQESLLAACLKDWEDQSVIMGQEISQLSTALKDAEVVIEGQRQSHKRAMEEVSVQLRDARGELREAVKAHKQAEHAWHTEKVELDLEEARMRESLQKRDKIIEQVLLDAEKRDGVLIELHQNISSKIEPRVALKHTL
ncbi:uncharacterized protein si:ch73-95l15.5 [Electrophorus electricus]|nr:uncharacterized protein si:ch73-95l15.5 [Electrophorus electricus]XP_026880266.2 uncharacterized protein si:ch73-95l15.5 [Electrophorus electricus]